MGKEQRRFDWIFFDLDGTLADSIPASYQAHCDFLTDFGKSGDKEEFEALNGWSLSETVRFLKKKHFLDGHHDDLLWLYRDKIVKAYQGGVKLFDQARPVLDELVRRKYKLQLVTSADHELGMAFLKSQGLEGYFDGFVFGDEVERAKPDPAIYRQGIKQAGVSPNSVAVVEDSCNGVKSAKAAGAFVVGLAGNQKSEDLSAAGADEVIRSLTKLLPLI